MTINFKVYALLIVVFHFFNINSMFNQEQEKEYEYLLTLTNEEITDKKLSKEKILNLATYKSQKLKNEFDPNNYKKLKEEIFKELCKNRGTNGDEFLFNFCDFIDLTIKRTNDYQKQEDFFLYLIDLQECFNTNKFFKLILSERLFAEIQHTYNFNRDLIIQLIKKGADVNYRRNDCFIVKSCIYCPNLLKIFLENGANNLIDSHIDNDGHTLLTFSILKCLPYTIKLLTDFNVNINYADCFTYGRNALMLTILKVFYPNDPRCNNFLGQDGRLGNYMRELIFDLLLAGCDPYQKDFFGECFMDYAKKSDVLMEVVKSFDDFKENRKKLILDKTHLLPELNNIVLSYL